MGINKKKPGEPGFFLLFVVCLGPLTEDPAQTIYSQKLFTGFGALA
jgi:hypothetical protein